MPFPPFPPNTHDEREFKNLMGFSEYVLRNEFFEIFFMIISILKVRKPFYYKRMKMFSVEHLPICIKSTLFLSCY